MNRIKQSCVLFFALLTVFQAYTQTDQSLQDIHKFDDDTNKVKQLVELAKSYKMSNVDSALIFSSQSIKLSNLLGYDKGLAETYYLKAVIYINIGKFDSALMLSDTASKIYSHINDKKGIADNYNLSGSLLRRKGYISTALDYHRKSLLLFTSLNDSIGLAKTYNFIGIVYKESAVYDSALFYYLKLINISELLHYNEGYYTGLLNVGQIYMDVKDYNLAEKYLYKCLLNVNSDPNHQRKGLVNNKLGILKYYQGDFDSASYYLNIALREYESMKVISGMAHVYVALGMLFEKRNEWNKALETYLLAKSFFEKIGLKKGILTTLNNLAIIYESQNKFQHTLAYYDSAIFLAKEIHAKDELLQFYDNTHRTYKTIGNKDKALEYQDKYVALKDSIFNLEKAEIIADLELKYEKEKNEAQILTLNNENLKKDLELKKESNRKNMFMAGGGLFFLIAVFLILYFRQRIRKNRQLTEQKLMKAEEEKKLSSAQALLEGQEEERMRVSKELHDGVGVLLSTANLYLSSVAEDEDKNKELLSKAHQIVNDANQDVRKISRNLMPTVLSMNGLNDALYELIDNIDKLPGKYGEFNVSGDIIHLSKPREVMVYRLIQELVSNTMKHAQAESVDLELEYKPNELIITYKDDGIGFDFDKEMNKKSVGLKSIKSRIDFLKGSMTFNSEKETGAIFRIMVPTETENGPNIY